MLKRTLFFVLLTFDGSAYAQLGEVNLEMTGTIVAAGCDVRIESQEQNVHIGDFPAATFTSLDSVTPFKAFNINLEKCSAGIAGAEVMFTGKSDDIKPDLLALSDTTGTGSMASGVAVEILNNGMKPIPINTPSSEVYPLSEGFNTLSFLLRYRATRLPVKAGNASAIMYFDLVYQ